MFLAIVSPYRIAFYDEEGVIWEMFDISIIIIFGLDLIFCFLTAFYDNTDTLILSKKIIALHYIKTWFYQD